MDNSPAAVPASSPASPGVCTTVLHRRRRGRQDWWADCVVYDFQLPLDGAGVLAAAAYLPQVARLGVQAVVIRPAFVALPAELDVMREFLATARRWGLKVIVRLSGRFQAFGPTAATPFWGEEGDADVLLRRARMLLTEDISGFDLGMIVESSAATAYADPYQFTALVLQLQAEIAAHLPAGILAADSSWLDRENHLRHLHEEWFHHLRCDGLETSGQTAGALAATAAQILRLNDQVGVVSAWRSNAQETGLSLGHTLLMLALPGAAYLHLGCEIGTSVAQLPGSVPFAPQEAGQKLFAHLATAVAGEREREESVYNTLRQALRRRRETGQGALTLAQVSALPWAGAESIVWLSSQLLVVGNRGSDPLVIPDPEQILLVSSPTVSDDSGRTFLAPGETAWLRPVLAGASVA